MCEAARLALSYVEGMDGQGFAADRRTQQAVIMNLVIVGEAATRLTTDHPEFAARFPQVPWKSMRGMRNRITHGYFDIDLAIVWQTVQAALPLLLEQLEAIGDEPPAAESRSPGKA
jgi:uncharacterized protein with HEPN domain